MLDLNSVDYDFRFFAFTMRCSVVDLHGVEEEALFALFDGMFDEFGACDRILDCMAAQRVLALSGALESF